MDWKQEAKEKLGRYNLLKTAMIIIPEEIAFLESESCSIKSAASDGNPVKGGGNGREVRLINNLMKREELKLQLTRTEAEVRNIERGLAAMTAEEHHILTVKYINCEKRSTNRLMQECNITDESWMNRKIQRILRKFALAMYGYTNI